MFNSRGWNIFCFWLNVGFALWWTLGLAATLALVVHHLPFSWGTLFIQFLFSILGVAFATQYKEQIWTKN